MAELKQYLENIPYNKAIQQITSSQLENVLAKENVASKLYPDGLIVLEHLAFNCSPTNVSHIAPYHDTILITGNDVTPGTSISIGGSISCDDEHGYRYNFNYSGFNDLNECLLHMYKHLKTCVDRQDLRESIYLIATIPNIMESKYGPNELTRFFSEKLSIPMSSVNYLHQYVFEYTDLKHNVLERKQLGLYPKL